MLLIPILTTKHTFSTQTRTLPTITKKEENQTLGNIKNEKDRVNGHEQTRKTVSRTDRQTK